MARHQETDQQYMPWGYALWVYTPFYVFGHIIYTILFGHGYILWPEIAFLYSQPTLL